jgi:hypothetical protein
MNLTPITTISSDPNDVNPLTPGHFLIGEPISNMPEFNLEHAKVNTLSRWQMIQKIKQHFWKCWSKMYLNELQQRAKWTTAYENVEPDQIVLVKEDNLPPARWLLGKIVSTVTGKDGKVRVVIIKTKNGKIQRSISKICILPTD